ncbi:MAG TPA: (2Fe-2S)-binding protein [Acidimicrobiales bacterium]|nr:(2Fe-2S)-binding protein [Acidimicrobiales bacterium]
MVICHCNAVNDAAIRAEIDAGAVDVEEVTARCGAGDRCGSCRPVIEALLVTADATAVAIRSAAA